MIKNFAKANQSKDLIIIEKFKVRFNLIPVNTPTNKFDANEASLKGD